MFPDEGRVVQKSMPVHGKQLFSYVGWANQRGPTELFHSAIPV